MHCLPGKVRPERLLIHAGGRYCLQKGESQGQTRLILRVRVGWFTRTEIIPLDHGFYLIGPSHGRCI